MTHSFAIGVTILLIGLFGLIGVRGYQQTRIEQPKNQQIPANCPESVLIANHQICVEVADTDPKRQQGLSGRERLQENHGMLLVFPQPALHALWMKDMKFALDFLWIRDSRVVDITLDVSPPKPGTPPNQLKVYSPDEPVDSVLEVNAGTVAALGIATGDAVVRK